MNYATQHRTPTERESNEWRDNPERVYTIGGRRYDYLSASHNGLVGMGATLARIIANERRGQ